MSKCIKIDQCRQCSAYHQKGAWGQVSYVPYCGMTKKELPYTVHCSRGMVTARYTGVIPEWCPLPDYAEEIDGGN